MVVFSQVIQAGVATRVLARNPKRAAYTITNFSGYDFFLGHDQDVRDSGTDMGHKLVNGSGWEDEFWKGEVWLYGTTTGTVTVDEVVKEE